MTRPKDVPPLVHEAAQGLVSMTAAATALDAELQRFEELAIAAHKQPLKSQKNIERAARTTREAAASQERFGAHLRALVDAVAAARDRQQAGADALAEAAKEIKLRTSQLEALMARFAEVGSEAGAINALVRELGAPKRDAADGPPAAGVLARLGEIQSRMSAAVDAAQTIAADAKAADLTDIERQADALRQQLLSARNKVQMVERRLAGS